MVSISELNSRLFNSKIIIVDLDGTLIDTDLANNLAYKEAIKDVLNNKYAFSFDVNRITRKDIKNNIIHHKYYEKIITIKNIYYEQFLDRTRVNKNLLTVLYNIPTEKLILATRGGKRRALQLLEYHNIKDYFYLLYFKEDFKNELKVKFLSDFLNIEYKDIFIIEDSEDEINSSISIGFPVNNIYRVF